MDSNIVLKLYTIIYADKLLLILGQIGLKRPFSYAQLIGYGLWLFNFRLYFQGATNLQANSDAVGDLKEVGFYEQARTGRRAGQKQGHSSAEFRKETNDRFKLIFTILDELIPDDQEGGRKIGII
jgi:hypothetical protein